MAHTVIGNVSGIAYNATQDKGMPTNVDLPAGALLVAISAGYGTDGTIDLTGVTDGGSNTWDYVKISAASASRFAMIAWARLDADLPSGSIVTINMTGTFTRSFAVLRAYTGLGASEIDKKSAQSSGIASTGSVATSGQGRAISLAFYPSEFFSGDKWLNSFIQTVNYNNPTNIDAFTVGERSFSGSGGVTPTVDIGVNSQYAIVAVTLPEQAMPNTRRPRRVVML